MRGTAAMDIKRLREALLDYYGTSIDRFPVAIMDISRIQEASDDELIQIGLELGLITVSEVEE